MLLGGLKPQDVILIFGLATDKSKKFAVNLMTKENQVSRGFLIDKIPIKYDKISPLSK